MGPGGSFPKLGLFQVSPEAPLNKVLMTLYTQPAASLLGNRESGCVFGRSYGCWDITHRGSMSSQNSLELKNRPWLGRMAQFSKYMNCVSMRT